MKAIFSVILSAILLCLVIAAGLVANTALRPMSQQEEIFTVDVGMGFARLADELEEQSLINSARLLRLFRWWRGSDTPIRAGEYRIEAGMLPGEFLDMVEQGSAIHHTFTIIPGSTTEQVLIKLRGLDTVRHTLPESVSVEDVMARVSLGDYRDHFGEGMFYADTYHFHRGITDIELLRLAHRLLLKRIEQHCAELPESINSAYEALILASIVEKESGPVAEHPQIATVFLNRLERGMRLEADPTVIYGLGDDYQGNIRKIHLRSPTPYNTYTIEGLPPTPIANIWQEALKAVCQPIEHDYLFFVADGSGGHVFNTTYDGHRRAVGEYLRWQREQR